MLLAKRASKTSPPQTPRLSGSPSSDVPALEAVGADLLRVRRAAHGVGSPFGPKQRHEDP